MSRRRDALEIIHEQRDEQRRLCRQLENLADRLPAPVDLSTSRHIHAALEQALPAFNRNEEKLFSLVAAHCPNGFLEYTRLSMLIRTQHSTHNAFADEFGELFLGTGTGHEEAQGYMLRYFFETLSSHLDWEDIAIMPLAEKVLSENELSALATQIVVFPLQ